MGTTQHNKLYKLYKEYIKRKNNYKTKFNSFLLFTLMVLYAAQKSNVFVLEKGK